MEIYDIKAGFNFSQLKLIEPKRLQGGTYFSQINYNENEFYLNIPKCNTKNGIVKTTKRSYIDLLYSDSNTQLIEWIMNLEKKIKELILSKSNLWFDNDVSSDDVDYLYNSPLRSYKQKNYILRCYINQNDKLEKNSNLYIYDEDNNIKDIDDVKNKEILSIIQIKGIRFTNDSFNLELEIKQIMILDDKPIFSKFLIKKPQNKNVDNFTDEESNDGDCLLIDHDNESNDNQSINDESNNDESNKHSENQIQNQDENDNESEIKEKNKVSLEENINNKNCDNKDTKICEKTFENLEQKHNLGNKNDNIDKQSNLENIVLDIQQIDRKSKETNGDTLEEITINTNNLDSDEIIKLKRPNEVYYEIYREARRKAKLAKKAALVAYLEVKNIKKTYMLDDLTDSSEEEVETEDF